jgi:DNA-binding MarR family transcriptional regulator
MPSDPGFELVTAVLSTADAFLREGQRLFRPHGLTSAQYNVLNILAEEPVGISQRELGDRLVVDRSNVTGLLDRMEAAGWVRRDDHPEDRRVYRVSLTPAGRALWKKIHPRYLKVVNQVTEGLAPAKMADGVKMLRRLELAARDWKIQ